jgi:hypothetical protein
MDLGYSSSSSDSESEIPSNVSKRNNSDVNEELDVLSIFKFTKPEQLSLNKKRRKVNDIDDVIKKVLHDTHESEETDNKSEVTNEEILEENHFDDDKQLNIPGIIEKVTDIKEFNMNEFYKDNQKAIESGQVDVLKQTNSAKVTLHRGARGVGNLEDVIKFNLNNETRISYQNKERIAKEKALAKDKI